MTTSWSRSPFQHFQLSSGDVNSLHMLPKYCQWRCGCNIVSFRLSNCQQLQIGHSIGYIIHTELGGHVPSSRLSQFLEPCKLLPKLFHVLQYHIRDCIHHPGRFVIFAQLVQLCTFLIIIIIIFPILFGVGTCKIKLTVSDSIILLLKYFFRLPGCPLHLVCISHIIRMLHNCSLCVFNSLACHRSLTVHIIFDSLLCLLVA